MSLFGGFFSDFSDDPIFGGHLNHMNRMSMMDPFEMMGGFGFPFGPRPMNNPLMPYGFPNINSIMDNFEQFHKQQMNSGNCHAFSSSTLMTMTSGPNGQPQYYQESSTTRTAPGGVKETKKAVCDSRTGTKRLAIGRHIGDRGHVKERVDNIRSGEREETEDFINLEEDEAEQFNQEWRRKTADLNPRRYEREVEYERPRAIMAGPSSSSVAESGPIIEEVDDDDEVIVENTRKRQRERQVPEITEVIESEAQGRSIPRKIKQRSRKFLNKLIN